MQVHRFDVLQQPHRGLPHAVLILRVEARRHGRCNNRIEDGLARVLLCAIVRARCSEHSRRDGRQPHRRCSRRYRWCTRGHRGALASATCFCSCARLANLRHAAVQHGGMVANHPLQTPALRDLLDDDDEPRRRVRDAGLPPCVDRDGAFRRIVRNGRHGNDGHDAGDVVLRARGHLQLATHSLALRDGGVAAHDADRDLESVCVEGEQWGGRGR